MDLGPLRELVVSINFDTFGLPAVVELEAGAVDTTGIWITPATDDFPGSSLQLTRREPARIIGIPTADAPAVPNGTIIRAPLVSGGVVKEWRVEGFDRFENEHARYRVLEVPES